MDDLIAHAMGVFYLSPLLVLAFFCLRWAYREIDGAEQPRSFLVAVNVIVALICLIIAFYFYGLFVGQKVKPTNWNTGESYEMPDLPPRTVYTEKCKKFVYETLRCTPDVGNHDLGYFVDGVLVSGVDEKHRKHAVRSYVICGNANFSLKENYIPEEYLQGPDAMTLGEYLKADTRLYPTCKYSFICETQETQTGWKIKLISGKLERFGKRSQESLSDPIWRPDEWETMIPATQELCRKFLFDVKKIEKQVLP
jgi:hypothetical protein